MKEWEKWSEHTRRLPQLSVGDFVRIQNQVGPHPLKWDKTGVVIEVKQFDQYIIKIDGSNRVTLRNRKFLRKYQPAITPVPKRTLYQDILIGQPQDHAPNPNTNPNLVKHYMDQKPAHMNDMPDPISNTPARPTGTLIPKTVETDHYTPRVSENIPNKPITLDITSNTPKTLQETQPTQLTVNTPTHSYHDPKTLLDNSSPTTGNTRVFVNSRMKDCPSPPPSPQMPRRSNRITKKPAYLTDYI